MTDTTVMQAACYAVAAALMVLVIAELFGGRSPKGLRNHFGMVGAGVGVLFYVGLRLWLRWPSKNWLMAAGGVLLTVLAFGALGSTTAAIYHAATHRRPTAPTLTLPPRRRHHCRRILRDA